MAFDFAGAICGLPASRAYGWSMPENAINVGDFTHDILDWGGSRIRSADARARRAIHERPIVYLLGAVVLGALIGRLLSR